MPDRSCNQKLHELVVTEDELRELKRSPILNPECECLLHGATIAHDGIVIQATLEEFEELEEQIAADANHEEKRRRQRILDCVYERIEALFDQEHYYIMGRTRTLRSGCKIASRNYPQKLRAL